MVLPENASSVKLTESGSVTVVRDEQFPKASFPIDSSPVALDRSTDVSPQSLNAFSPMVVRADPSGIDSVSRLEVPLNTLGLISTRVSGMDTETRLSTYWNAASTIVVNWVF